MEQQSASSYQQEHAVELPRDGKPRRILVIKLGGLGQLMLATGAMESIRFFHPQDHMVLLTGDLWADFAQTSGLFDEVWLDKLHSSADLVAMWKFRKWLISGKFDRVYDLDCNKRSNLYFRLMGFRKPQWCGDAKWASHRYSNPYTDVTAKTLPHVYENYRHQLSLMGMTYHPRPNLKNFEADITKFALPQRYALVSAGGLYGVHYRRFPQELFEEICGWLQERGITPLLIGAAKDVMLLHDMHRVMQSRGINTINLNDKTSLSEVASLARGAVMAVGNDNGVMQLIALAGCPSVLLAYPDNMPQFSVPASRTIRYVQPASMEQVNMFDVAPELETVLALDTAAKPAMPEVSTVVTE